MGAATAPLGAPARAAAAATSQPFPYAKVAIIGLVQLANTVSYLATYPMVAFMVLSFDPTLTKAEVGYRSGFLEGTYHVGATFGALAWGWYSDTYGRKPATLYGLAGTVVSALLFGCSRDYATACTARFLWGFLNQNIGVVKVMLSESTTDEHTPRAFSIIGLNTGIGRVLGPALGGLLSEPATKYPSLFGGSALLRTFPFLLPCAVCAAGVLAIMVASAAVLQETLHLAKSEQAAMVEAAAAAAAAATGDATVGGAAAGLPSSTSAPADDNHDDVEDGALLVSPASASASSAQRAVAGRGGRGGSGSGGSVADRQPADVMLTPHVAAMTSPTAAEAAAAAAVPDDDGFALDGGRGGEGGASVTPQLAAPVTAPYRDKKDGAAAEVERAPLRPATASPPAAGAAADAHHHRRRRGPCANTVRLLSDRAVAVSIGLYALLGLGGLVANELFPLYALLPPSRGGFGWRSTQIGLASALAGPPLILFQLFVYDRLVKRHGVVTVARWSLALTTAAMASQPLCSLALPLPPAAQQAVLTAHFACTALMRVASFTSVFLFVANSALPLDRGRVNGLSQSLVSVARAVGPPLFTPLFAWSVEAGRPYPFNAFLSWHLLALLTAATLALTYALPPWIERKRVQLKG
jgi:MFS family permease